MRHPREEDRKRVSVRRAPLLRTTRRFSSDGIGQSETLAVVLLLGIAVIGISVSLYLGFLAFDGNKDRADFGQAEQSFSQLDSEASDVALGDAPVRDVDLGLRQNDGQARTAPNDGWIRVAILNKTTGADEWNTTVTIGAVIYEDGGETVAYQGGGVWRGDRHGSVMVSRPEVQYRAGTLTVPLIAVRGQGGIDSHVQVTPAGQIERRFPDPTNDSTNRIKDGKVSVTVHSEYYEAWGEYFEESTNAVVYYDHGAEQATAVFLALPDEFSLNTAYGIIATAGSGRVRLAGKNVYVDSYNSSNGTYSQTQTSNGTLTAVNNVTSTGSAELQGDIYAGHTANLSGTTDVYGTVHWTENYFQNGAYVVNGDKKIPGVATIEPIDGYVADVVSNASRSNDNANESTISNNQISSSGTITAGTYYLHDLTLGPGESLEFDTSNGNITVAVRDYVDIAGKGTQDSKSANVEVTGNGTVRIVIAGKDDVDVTVNNDGTQETRQANFHLGKNSQISVPKNRSPQFRVYGKQSFVGVIASDNSPAKLAMEGVIYAPGGMTGTGSVFVKQGKYFGGIVAGSLNIQQNAEIHYDKGLGDARFPRSPTVSRLDFLHVAVHPINVSDANVQTLLMESGDSSGPASRTKGSSMASRFERVDRPGRDEGQGEKAQANRPLTVR